MTLTSRLKKKTQEKEEEEDLDLYPMTFINGLYSLECEYKLTV